VDIVELKDRLKLARKNAKLTQKDVEKGIANMKQSTYSELERGASKSTSRIVDLANLFNVSTDWLASGKGDMLATSDLFDDFILLGADNRKILSSEYVMIKQYDIKEGCSDKGLVDSTSTSNGLAFKREWIKSMGVNSDDLAVMIAPDDSMSPTINEGQTLLVNTVAVQPQSTKIYLICIDGSFYIKRLINMLDKWIMRSDNANKSSYPDIEVSLETMTKLDIKGRIVWQAGAL
jgi:phage repressor protein C with HTH and peptisase S24 domain